MNIKKLILVVISALGLTGCAAKEYSANNYKNYTAAQILQRGEQAVAKHDFNDAAKYFEAIDALYPFDHEAEQGQLNVIYAYYKAGDQASALAAADRYIHLYPEGKHTDYAYYMKGVVNFDKHYSIIHRVYTRRVEKVDVANLREAFFNFQEMLNKFPHSVYAKDAEIRMHYIRNLLAEHELYIAKFYFDRKAYVASANRASYIVKHFEGAPQIKDALKIMKKSYEYLGLTKQAKDAVRIYQLNFPGQSI